jgi:hypothetical protein
MLPALPPEQRHADELQRMPTAKMLPRTTDSDRRRGEAYMAQVLDKLASEATGGRNAALNHAALNYAAWTLGRWIAAGVLEQACVEDVLYVGAVRNGLVADDGERQTWPTICKRAECRPRGSLSIWTARNKRPYTLIYSSVVMLDEVGRFV